MPAGRKRKIDEIIKDSERYTTGLEIQFIKMISSREDKTAWAGYVHSLQQRVKWGLIDRKAVYDEVNRIRREQKREAS